MLASGGLTGCIGQDIYNLFHRITEWQGLEGTSVGLPVHPPAEAGSPRAGCTGPCPGGSGISPEKETSQPQSHFVRLKGKS